MLGRPNSYAILERALFCRETGNGGCAHRASTQEDAVEGSRGVGWL